MVNNTQKLLKQGSVESLHNRLENIKTVLDSQGGHTTDSIYRICKGSSGLYVILKQAGIIIPTEDGLIWNNKIPVTKRLALSISDKQKEYHRDSKERYFKRKKANVTSVKKVVSVKKPVLNSTAKKSVNLFWGLVKFDY